MRLGLGRWLSVVKCWPCKHEELSSDLSICIKSQERQPLSVISVLGRQTQRIHLAQIRVSEKPCPKNTVEND